MTQLLQNAAYGAALILAVAALRRVLKGRLVPEARLALWAVCLFRLLTPAAPSSALSLWGLFQSRQAPAVPAPAPVTGTPQLYTPPQAVPQPGPSISWETVLLAAWLAAGTVLALRYVLSWRRTRRAVACAIPVGRDDPRYAPLPKCARLREGPMEGAPLTFGALRPTVVLSLGLEGKALDCVLAHEGVHAQRRDNLWHYAMALALIAHWWNPAVWLMSRLLRRDIELSCDRAALKKLGADRRADYANTLVTLAAQGDGPAFCQTFGRKAAEERILSIMKFKKTSVIGAVLTLALVLAVTVAFASEPAERLPDEESTTSSAPAYRLPNEISAYVEKLSVGMSRENVHILLGEPSFSMSHPYSDTYELDDTHKPQVGIYYDVDSAVIQVKYFSDGTDPDAPGIDLTPILTASGQDQPAYQDISGYQVVLPEVDENGVSHVYDEDGNVLVVGTPRTPFGTPLCDGADCDIANPHIHYDGQVIYVDYHDPYTDPVPVPSAAPEPAGTDLPSIVAAPSTSCGVEGCTETRYHAHNEGLTILLNDPCPLEGCAITGNHIHGDVCYSCNGAGHDGGVCDGSCYTYTSLPEYVLDSTGTHRKEPSTSVELGYKSVHAQSDEVNSTDTDKEPGAPAINTYVELGDTIDPSLREALEAAWHDRIMDAVAAYLQDKDGGV